MPTLLHIDCSPQRNLRSISRQITAAGVEAWRRRYPRGTVIYRDLTRTPLLPVGQDWIDGVDQNVDVRTEEQRFALLQSDQLVDEFLSADHLLIGAPMHNFTVPSVLKLWLDQVFRVDRKDLGQKHEGSGNISERKAIVAIASGGDYSPGSEAENLDFETPYLDFILRCLGIHKVHFLHAYGTGRVKQGDISAADFLRPLCQEMVHLVTTLDGAPLALSSQPLEQRRIA